MQTELNIKRVCIFAWLFKGYDNDQQAQQEPTFIQRKKRWNYFFEQIMNKWKQNTNNESALPDT